ncbi:TPA: GIY-YIG nuclease family protein [Streptococcus suis]|nr:GIY-YIG nuclease family protein [Streptococcus suis]
MGYIYRIECRATNRRYYGQSMSINRRFDDHKYKLRHNQHYSEEMQSDFNKYGECSFSFVVIEEVQDDVLDERERFWITNDRHVYNIENGGRWTKELAESTKQKIGANAKKNYSRVKERLNSPESIKKRSISNTGKKRSIEFREKMSELGKKRIGTKNSFYGQQHSEETKRKISEANRGGTGGGKKPIPIVAIHLENGERREFTSIEEATKDIFRAKSSIYQVLRGEKKSYKGYTFKKL